MNPSDSLRMMWMQQYNPTLDDAATSYFHPNVALSVMDDLSQQQQHQQQQQQQQQAQQTMDLNPMIVGGNFAQTNLLAANANDIYGLTQMNTLQQQLLQQSAAAAAAGVFSNFTAVSETGGGGGGDCNTTTITNVQNFNNAALAAAAAAGGILVNSDGKPITTAQFLTAANAQQQQQQQQQQQLQQQQQHHQQQQQQQQQQLYNQMHNDEDDVDDDEDTYDDGISEHLTPKQEIINIDDFVMMTDSNSYDGNDFMNSDNKSTAGIDITQPHGLNDHNLLESMNSVDHKMLSDAVAAAAAASNRSKLALSTKSAGSVVVGGGGSRSRKTRKIEPVNRPGLVLKTPIAYKGNIDPSVIPIQKDGMAVCERCGAIGVKHTFYTKARRFCSMACARGELYSLVVNKPQLPITQQQQLASMDSDNQQQLQQQQSDIELALRVAQMKNSNYRFRITDQSKITQINGFGEPITSNNNKTNNSMALNGTNNHNTQLQQAIAAVAAASATSQLLQPELVGADGDNSCAVAGINSAQQQQQQIDSMQPHTDANTTTTTTSSNTIQYTTDNIEAAELTQTPKALRMYRDVMPQDELPQIPKYERLPASCPQMEKIISIRRRLYDPTHSYDWTSRLSHTEFYAAPVSCFPHAPGCDVWDNLGIDMKVEVENTDCDQTEVIQPGQTPHSFWVATILDIQGYKALMRYEGFEDEAHDFWVNLCNAEVHAVGWCATRGKPLIPPRSIENKYTDWKDFLVSRLSGARTLPSSFYNKVNDSMQSRFRLGLNLECVDKDRISQVRLATVTKIVGKRLFLRYFDSDDGFWCHEDSPIIHPVGWATTVGHNLAAPQDYLERMLAGREAMIEVHEDDATIELFKMNFTFEEYYLEGKTNGFMEGMKLEAVDPLNLSSICVATVMAVLKFGYMMIRIDSYQPDATGSDWFCYHEKSPNIFPVGFCAANTIHLTPPNGYDVNNFTWEIYLRDTKAMPAGQHLFHREIPNHGFEVGMSLECADLMDPRLVCVATVSRVVGRLLKIHFDGWTEEYDQWLDCESADIYPVGWCVLVNHKLEGPPAPQPAPSKAAAKPKAQKKRKKKSPNTSLVAPANRNHILAQHQQQQQQLQQQQQHTSNQIKPRTIALKTTPHLPKLSIKLELKPEHQNPAFYENPAANHGNMLQHNDGDDHDIEDIDDYEDDDEDEEDEYEEDTSSLPSNQSLLLNQNQAGAGSTLSSTLLVNPAAAAAAAAAGSNDKNSSVSNSKYIPRLSGDNNETASATCASAGNEPIAELMPDSWNVYDVSQFLRVNDCTAHCDLFSRNKIDGKRLLQLSKDEIITLLGMKVGPALKIYDLIQQLKCKVNPGKSRMKNKYL